MQSRLLVEYGVPAEELARFATRVSEARNWLATERGKKLVVRAKFMGLRRDETATTTNMIATKAENSTETLSDDCGNDDIGNDHNRSDKGYLELIGSYHPTLAPLIKMTYSTMVYYHHHQKRNLKLDRRSFLGFILPLLPHQQVAIMPLLVILQYI